MPLRSITAEPQEIELLGHAFDAAWAEVNSRGAIDTLSQPAARERLSYIIMRFWKAGEQDLVRRAVEGFAQSDFTTRSAQDEASTPVE